MNVELGEFSIPLATPLETADGVIEARSGFLVRIDGDGSGEWNGDPESDGPAEVDGPAEADGTCDESRPTVGVGEATPLPGWTESVPACRAALEDAAERLESTGQSAALEALEDGTPAARHGLSLALHDLAARRAGRPLYRELGGSGSVERVPVNATIGDGSPEATAASARSACDEGFQTIKVKVGARSVDADDERLTAIRRVVGDDVALRADANGAWNLETARDALQRFQAASLDYVEQPLPADDLQSLARFREAPIDVALDESLRSTSVEQILAADAADVLVLKPMVLGGPDRTVEVARRARDAGLDVVVSTTVDAVVARTGAAHVAAALAPIEPCGLATGDRLASDLAPDPAPVASGELHVPQTAGSGVDVGHLETDSS